MEKLVSSVTRVCDIEALIYKENGELTPFTEAELYNAKQELSENVESVAFAYKRRQAELEYIKSSYKNAVESRKLALEKFKHTILEATISLGRKLKTPLASISITERKSDEVIILDFDAAVEECPAAVHIDTQNNIRTIRLSKTVLKEHFKTKSGGVNGYEVNERITKFPNVRIKGGQSNVTLSDLPE